MLNTREKKTIFSVMVVQCDVPQSKAIGSHWEMLGGCKWKSGCDAFFAARFECNNKVTDMREHIASIEPLWNVFDACLFSLSISRVFCAEIHGCYTPTTDWIYHCRGKRGGNTSSLKCRRRVRHFMTPVCAFLSSYPPFTSPVGFKRKPYII